MEKDFEKNLVLKTLNLHREFVQLTNEPLPYSLQSKIHEDLDQLIKPLLNFVIPESKRMGSSSSESIKSCLNKAIDVTETIVEGYNKDYLREVKSRFKTDFDYCEKPQLLFKDKIDNSEASFIPKLKEKHNRLAELDPYFLEYQKVQEFPPEFKFGHPYQHELEQLRMDYGLLLKAFSNPNTKIDFSVRKLTYIDSYQGITDLLAKISNQNSLFFDLHNHSHRSFQGFICFIEISLATEDFIIDALKLREHLHLLNIPFSDPKILKVGLETNEKILWLQRDFGIYVVNLIDLKFILNRVNLPTSIPFLANRFFNLSFKDIYVEFDLRKRPVIPIERTYLRSFSNLILHLFFSLKELAPKYAFDQFFEEIFEDSKKLCLNTYEKPSSNESYSKFLTDSRLNLNMSQLNKLRKMLSWRDYSARLEDESYEYILPDELLERILLEPPKDIEELKALLKANSKDISIKHFNTLYLIIEDKDHFQENKEISKFELNENSNEILQSLFTPTRNMFRSVNGNLLEKESPAYDQNELHKIIHWSSGKKDMGDLLFDTPKKLFDEFLTKGVLTPSGILDSPNENANDDLVHLRNIINNRNDSNFVKREVQKIPFIKGSGNELNEIKEEDAAIDSLEFSTMKENLPQNIGEIYELGNNIRKRNKNKKKKDLKHTKIPYDLQGVLDYSQTSSQYSENSRMSHGTNKGVKSNKEEVTSDNILRDLGWI